MKKKITVILLTLALLAGCQSQAPAAPSATDTPDIETIIQQSVDEAVQEKMKEYEEEQRKKDEEIARLKDQLEDLTGRSEVPPEENEDENGVSGAPASSQSTAPASPSQAEVPPQPEPEPLPQSTPAPKKTAPSSSQGFDLRNLYPGIDFEETPAEEQDAEEPHEEEPEDGTVSGEFLEDNAQEVIRLVNEERESQDLKPLDVDDNLMALAQIRAKELSEKFSHERPDGTHAAQAFCGGENIAGNFSSPSAVMETWMGSEGHRNNILRERFRYIGVGCYKASNGELHWVQLFSPRKT